MTSVDLLRPVAAHGLGHGGVVEIPPDRLPALLVEATAHKLVGLLDQAVADGVVACDEASAERIGDRAVEVAASAVLLERHLLRLHDHLEAIGVPYRLLKGASVAHRFYDHPGLRMSVDIDVLVERRHLDAVLAELAERGHVRQQRDPYPGFSKRYAKSVTMRHGPTGIEVDVHRILPDGPFGLRARPDVLWERPPAHLHLAGRTLPVLDPVATFVHACVNAVASFDLVSLASLRDVAQVGVAVADDGPAVDALSGALGVRACVTEAVRLASTELGWTPPGDLVQVTQRTVTSREREWLDSYRRPPSDVRRALLGVRAVPTSRGKVAYAFSVTALAVGRPRRRRNRRRGIR